MAGIQARLQGGWQVPAPAPLAGIGARDRTAEERARKV